MVNGSRYYRAPESVSTASALSTALTIYQCQIRVHQRWQSNSNFLQLGRRSGGRLQRAVHPMWLPVNTVIHTTLVGLEPATLRSLVDCWSDALSVVPPTHSQYIRVSSQLPYRSIDQIQNRLLLASPSTYHTGRKRPRGTAADVDAWPCERIAHHRPWSPMPTGKRKLLRTRRSRCR